MPRRAQTASILKNSKLPKSALTEQLSAKLEQSEEDSKVDRAKLNSVSALTMDHQH